MKIWQKIHINSAYKSMPPSQENELCQQVEKRFWSITEFIKG